MSTASTLRTTRAEGRRGSGARGQVVVLFALAIVALLAAAGLAIDIGRFYSERRFLQNAADAAALAVANAMIRGGTTTEADTEARSILTRNFAGDPTGISASLPPATPVYEPGHAGDLNYLVDGIVISGDQVRVAVRNSVDYTFGRVVGLNSTIVGARARSTWRGRLLPIAVSRYLNPPGPNAGASYPCPLNLTKFEENFATELTGCLGDEGDGSLRTPASTGAAFNATTPDNDPSNHGPIVPILGQGAQPANGADFRGFVALDIRNFSADGSQVYFNNVTSGTNGNTLKAMEADYIYRRGYPGPGFPPAVSPPDPNDQVSALSGNSTGAAIDAMIARYRPGDEILVCVYPGQVLNIPDFSISPPAAIALPETGLTANAGTMKVSRNQSFSGTVTLSTVADSLDPDNPMVQGTLVGSDPITYTPNPVTPSLGSGTTVQLQNMTTASATPGIYIVWIKGQAGSPYLTTKYEPLGLKIGTVTRDFTFTSDAGTASAANPGDTVSFNLTLTNAPNKNTSFGGSVALSVDTPLPAGVGAITLSPSSVSPSKTGASSTLSINTGSMAPGEYRFVVRATGMNGDSTPRKVTHLLPLVVTVATGGGSNDQYVDIIGFSVMRIVELNSNYVTAYAITPVIPDMNDQRLRRGQIAKLVPWQ